MTRTKQLAAMYDARVIANRRAACEWLISELLRELPRLAK